MSNEYKPTYVDNTDNSISIMESTDTISFCKTGTKINTLSAKNVAHKKSGEDLNLCAFNNSNFNPVITINNNHSDCRITTNLNVNGNLNITKNLNVIGNINLTNEGMIKTTGIGSFGSINCGVGTFTNLNATSISILNLSSSKALISNSSGKVAVSSVSSTELGYLDGVTSAIQTQINGKQNTITGAASSITSSNLSAYQALISNSSGKVAVHSSVSSTELGYLDGVTSAIQTQLNGKASSDHSHSSFNNKVMIGLGAPAYPLHITNTQGLPSQVSYSTIVIDHGSSYNFQNNTYWPAGTQISIKSAGGVWVSQYHGLIVSSDSRIKTNIVDVPDNLALQQLRSIPCRYYEYIDKITLGSDKTIGFIAQEVKAVMPMAVSLQKEIIPNVYKVINCTWTSNGDKFMMRTPDLSNVNGIKYKFYVSNASVASDTTEKEIIIIGNSDDTFTFDAQYTNVFCYGSEVDDFHTLTKSKLFTLNFSATQEIDRIQQTHITEIASLKIENQQQQTKINTLETEVSTLETEVSTLKTENTELKSIIDKLKTANSFEEFKNSL